MKILSNILPVKLNRYILKISYEISVFLNFMSN